MGRSVFITSVTYKRRPILIDNIDLLKKAIKRAQSSTPFEVIAYVILPDHFHFLINAGDNDFTTLLQRVKMSFGAYYRKREALVRGRVWQHRFWDHLVRDQVDLNNHIDYIHYNPVKHGFCNRPIEWQHSSFHRYHQEGIYPADWGIKDKNRLIGAYGEYEVSGAQGS